jgi:hypothetical protein
LVCVWWWWFWWGLSDAWLDRLKFSRFRSK